MSGWQPDRAQVLEVDCMKKLEGILPPVVVWTEEGKNGPCAPAIDSWVMSSGGEIGLTMMSFGSLCEPRVRRRVEKRARATTPAASARRQARAASRVEGASGADVLERSRSTTPQAT